MNKISLTSKKTGYYSFGCFIEVEIINILLNSFPFIMFLISSPVRVSNSFRLILACHNFTCSR
ncbi:hypothetical protein [Ehrlichia muris]|uniref:hypothetical protein n=1 Tax=Ehrlichia muris TaxID=35795 RepID=UPI0011982825|nr:hypothetical protein [Ehrlichia muris]